MFSSAVSPEDSAARLVFAPVACFCRSEDSTESMLSELAYMLFIRLTSMLSKYSHSCVSACWSFSFSAREQRSAFTVAVTAHTSITTNSAAENAARRIFALRFMSVFTPNALC